MSKVGDSGGVPRALVHKRILDVAASKPEASIEDIAGEISAATPDLVERVFDEYGDPADQDEAVEAMLENEASTDEDASSPETDSDKSPPEAEADEGTDDPADEEGLTTKQRETARVVHRYPHASQQKVADELGVTRATVSRRLNDIPDFEWKNRAAITAALFGERPPENEPAEEEPADEQQVDDPEPPSEDEPDAPSESEQSGNPTQASETTEKLATVENRLKALETQMSDVTATETETASTDGETALPPGLAHKVVHAAMESDRVSEDEELQLLKALLE